MVLSGNSLNIQSYAVYYIYGSGQPYARPKDEIHLNRPACDLHIDQDLNANTFQVLHAHARAYTIITCLHNSAFTISLDKIKLVDPPWFSPKDLLHNHHMLTKSFSLVEIKTC